MHAAENPTLSFGELTKKLGEMWKGISEAEKAPYEVATPYCLPLSCMSPRSSFMLDGNAA